MKPAPTSSPDDPYRLGRFVEAQSRSHAYAEAVSELRQGYKRGHWMWFVFPQIAGLGQSVISREFAISSLAEAKAYLQHPVLGPRLIECARLVAAVVDTNATQMFGPVDAMKLRSSMTLFAHAAPDIPVFRTMLDRYFAGAEDLRTTRRTNACDPEAGLHPGPGDPSNVFVPSQDVRPAIPGFPNPGHPLVTPWSRDSDPRRHTGGREPEHQVDGDIAPMVMRGTPSSTAHSESH
jgi:uncharacterized protein (DUF1810 family)